MKTDSQIQNDVIDELKWDPSISHEHIGVAVNAGIVTLTGIVPTYFEKSAAEKATQRVAGVQAIAEKIEVRHVGAIAHDDESLAEAIVHAFKWNVQIPDALIKIQVTQGWVTLSGSAEWDYQKSAAENAVRSMHGVVGVMNSIEIKPQAQVSDVKAKIERALNRSAAREADRILVTVKGREVTLSGRVRSYSELREARGAAWSAPGITEVHDHLTVST